MEWSEEISFSCFNDGWKTFDTNFGRGKISLEQFLQHTAHNGEYMGITIKSLVENPPENLSVERLKAKSITEAYPTNDRPRGPADITSVKFHMRNKNTSPVFLVKFENRIIFLDGVHRCVAAVLSEKRKIHVFEVDLDKALT
jgi:hypothetical protein